MNRQLKTSGRREGDGDGGAVTGPSEGAGIDRCVMDDSSLITRPSNYLSNFSRLRKKLVHSSIIKESLADGEG